MRFLPLIAILLGLLVAPVTSFAADSETDDPPADTPADDIPADTPADDIPAEAAPAPPPRLDALGRPFPDPIQLRRSRTWSGVGGVMTGFGAAMVVGGLFLGSAVARGQLDVPDFGLGPRGRAIPILSLFSAGGVLVLIGTPTLSAGVFMNKQLRRTIKGAEKVPRTVANEGRYWNGYLGKMFAQALMVSGGGALLFGVLSIVAVGALIGTDQYQPEFWLAVPATFGTGAGLLAAGFGLSKWAKTTMEEVRDQVDPMRQQAAMALLPTPSVTALRRPDGRSEVRGTLQWAFRF